MENLDNHLSLNILHHVETALLDIRPYQKKKILDDRKEQQLF
jgi:hypothetical protein